ncbi:hypothetical protein FQR65_LT15288 [Abscondita terminalis]|nr:hypothetical protein FQR65_LT15288 [Abscondita terminalis]
MGYSLDPDFNHLFRVKGEFGPESVFEVDCSCSAQYGGSQYAEVQGVRNQFGWGFFTPSQALRRPSATFQHARERYHPDGNYPTDRWMRILYPSGGSGFGLMSIISAANRGYIKRKEAVERLNKIADFLTKADRFHGAWSHWIDGILNPEMRGRSTGYNAHMPGNDVGVVSPTAAISSIVYTPKESIAFIRNLYENYPDSWGLAGFYDALSPHYNWTAKWYLAIDQGPEVVMLENYRSGLIWKLFMNAPEIQQGLKKLGFTTSKYLQKGRKGLVGGLFNIKGVGKIRDVQKVAVEKSRLKIPMIFGMDVIHGYETTFPIPLGLSASWDMDLIQRSAQIAAQEASARWVLTGKDLSLKNTILACVNTFCIVRCAGRRGRRDYNTVDMSHIRMFNEYFPPYKAAVDAGVGSVMASFNEVDGIPATGNKWLMDDVLRKQWGFNGFIVTDYTGINEMIQHGMGDLQQVSALAMNAGIDMDMVGEGFLTTLKKSISEGKVTEQQIYDVAAEEFLEAKY